MEFSPVCAGLGAPQAKASDITAFWLLSAQQEFLRLAVRPNQIQHTEQRFSILVQGLRKHLEKPVAALHYQGQMVCVWGGVNGFSSWASCSKQPPNSMDILRGWPALCWRSLISSVSSVQAPHNLQKSLLIPPSSGNALPPRPQPDSPGIQLCPDGLFWLFYLGMFACYKLCYPIQRQMSRSVSFVSLFKITTLCCYFFLLYMHFTFCLFCRYIDYFLPST